MSAAMSAAMSAVARLKTTFVSTFVGRLVNAALCRDDDIACPDMSARRNFAGSLPMWYSGAVLSTSRERGDGLRRQDGGSRSLTRSCVCWELHDRMPHWASVTPAAWWPETAVERAAVHDTSADVWGAAMQGDDVLDHDDAQDQPERLGADAPLVPVVSDDGIDAPVSGAKGMVVMEPRREGKRDPAEATAGLPFDADASIGIALPGAPQVLPRAIGFCCPKGHLLYVEAILTSVGGQPLCPVHYIELTPCDELP
jgi:hypothetical protein